jgi:hypothetical protein
MFKSYDTPRCQSAMSESEKVPRRPPVRDVDVDVYAQLDMGIDRFPRETVIMVDVAGVHASIQPYQRRRGIVHVAGVPASTTSRRKRRRMRYRYRLIISMLLVSIPLMAALAVVLTTTSSTTLTSAADQRGVDVARAVTVRLEDWMSERHEDLAVVGDQLGGNPGIAETKAVLARTQHSGGDFALLEVVDLNGIVTVSSSDRTLDVAHEDWFRTVASGQTATV